MAYYMKTELPATVLVYKCLCDMTRLRILNLLRPGPLCVCHLQEILDEPQVRMSKQLAYMRRLGLVTVRRHENWQVYTLAEPRNPLMEQNLACLQDIGGEKATLKADLAARARLLKRLCSCGMGPLLTPQA
jgi:ArsR family transcriptional regulator